MCCNQGGDCESDSEFALLAPKAAGMVQLRVVRAAGAGVRSRWPLCRLGQELTNVAYTRVCGRSDREFALAVLNGVLGLLTALCIVTGFSIWLEWSDAEFWAITHTITGLFCIILVFVHLWRNRSRIRQLAAVR